MLLGSTLGAGASVVVMTPGSHARADHGHQRPRRPWGAWRLGTPAVVLLCGSLFVVSAANSEGTDLRPGRYTDLASFAKTESDQYADLQRRVQELNAEVERPDRRRSDDDTVKRIQRRIERMEDPAGLTPRTGPGVTVTLSDAPGRRHQLHERRPQPARRAPAGHPGRGQRDVEGRGRGGDHPGPAGGEHHRDQVRGQLGPAAGRALPAALRDHGRRRPVGHPRGDRRPTTTSRSTGSDADNPNISVGWELELEDEVTAPAYDGLLDITYAEPIR